MDLERGGTPYLYNKKFIFDITLLRIGHCLVSSRLFNILEMHPTFQRQYILHTHRLSAEGAQADVKKCKCLTILSISKYSFFFFLFFYPCSNLSKLITVIYPHL